MREQTYWQRIRERAVERPEPMPFEVWWVEWWDWSGEEEHGPAVMLHATRTLGAAILWARRSAEAMRRTYGDGETVVLDRFGTRLDAGPEGEADVLQMIARRD